VVVSIIALLIAILLPSLNKARQQAKSVICLSNLKSLSTGVTIYVADGPSGKLPGPLHPAVYRNQGLKALMEQSYCPMTYERARFEQERQLTWKLRTAFADSQSTRDSLTDRVSTCPVAEAINPDANFKSFHSSTGKCVFPTHYVINNVGENAIDEGSAGGALGNLRTTFPAQYFGFSPWAGAPLDVQQYAKDHPPLPVSRIKRVSAEWMIADAWYRPRTNPGRPELQQEGPYQWQWSGEALPNFAPHLQRHRKGYRYSSNRNQQSSTIRSGKRDGRTNTAFFDGHAASVASKLCWRRSDPIQPS
jgi:prepilin-type processing-associated H-X9-DG protein